MEISTRNTAGAAGTYTSNGEKVKWQIRQSSAEWCSPLSATGHDPHSASCEWKVLTTCTAMNAISSIHTVRFLCSVLLFTRSNLDAANIGKFIWIYNHRPVKKTEYSRDSQKQFKPILFLSPGYTNNNNNLKISRSDTLFVVPASASVYPSNNSLYKSARRFRR